MATEVTQATLGYLAELRRGNSASPEVFTAVAEITGVDGFGAESALVDVTHLRSPNGALEYISGMDDGAELSVTANLRLDHATQSPAAGLLYDQANKLKVTFHLYHPSWAKKARFDALVRGFKLGNVTPKEASTVSFTLKISGGIEWITP